jgi:hypothetical protein
MAEKRLMQKSDRKKKKERSGGFQGFLDRFGSRYDSRYEVRGNMIRQVQDRIFCPGDSGMELFAR